MKKREFVSLARQLLPFVPGAVVHGPMMAIVPIGQVFRGLYFEGSDFDAQSFYINAFWLPLYVPTKHIHFNFGKRLRDNRGADRWNSDSPQLLDDLAAAIRRDALPLFDKVESLQGVVEVTRQAAVVSKDPYVHQALSYALAMAGEGTEAVRAIDVLLGLLNPAVPWQAQFAARANLLKEKIADGTEEAGTMLEGWRAESIRSLGLDGIAGLSI